MSEPASEPRQTIALRPLATPLPVGFLALCVATFSFSALQLGWVPESQGSTIALSVLLFSAPLQLVASIMGFLGRDPVAATGMGLLAGTWAAASASTLTAPPGAASAGLGVILLAAAAALLVPAVAGHAKGVAALVMLLSSLRFAVTGVAELSGTSFWLTGAGWVGLALAALSLYAALAFELEGTEHHDVLPTGRRGEAKRAVDLDRHGDAEEVRSEPGAREQL